MDPLGVHMEPPQPLRESTELPPVTIHHVITPSPRLPEYNPLPPPREKSGRITKKTNWRKILDEDGGGVYFEGDVLAIRASNEEPFWLAYLDEDVDNTKDAVDITWFEADKTRSNLFLQGGADTVEQGTILCKVRLLEIDEGWVLPATELKVIKDILKDEDEPDPEDESSLNSSNSSALDSADSDVEMSSVDEDNPNTPKDVVSAPKPSTTTPGAPRAYTRGPYKKKLKEPVEDRGIKRKGDETIFLKPKRRAPNPNQKPEQPVRVNFQCYKCSFPHY